MALIIRKQKNNSQRVSVLLTNKNDEDHENQMDPIS